ncbi:DUF1198 domain-containing protein [Salmonella enterica]|nr:DUF1198 domain-containing protein [Salmonella enterica]
MIWLILATFVVVFIVGFSDTRRAIRRLSERLNIDVVPIESMIDQMGKTAGGEFLQYLHRPDESHLQNAAQVLLIWQIVIVDGGDQNLQRWHRLLQKARLAAPITDTQVRLALGFLREMEPNMQEINAFQLRYNAFFQPEEGVHWLH